MKYSTYLITLLLGLTLLGCGQSGSKNTSAKDGIISDSNNDKEQIENLLKQVLKWHETNGTFTGFEPISNAKDSLVVGMDLTKLKAELKKLKESNLFDIEFIDNYNNIVLKIDKKIKNKEIDWHDGEMPPYAGADPWCNCQDYPYDNPWSKIEIKFVSLNKDNAILTWTWGNSEWSKNFNYKVKAKKVDGSWRISYMQGFDINEFIR